MGRVKRQKTASAISESMPDKGARSQNGQSPGAISHAKPIMAPRRGAADTSSLASADVGATPRVPTRSQENGRPPGAISHRAAAVHLRLAAESLTDVERLRIATEHRLRHLHEVPSWSLSPAAMRWEAHLDQLRAVEHSFELETKRALRLHPLGPWAKRVPGIGEKQGGRLIAVLGDPVWNTAEDRPRRGPAELWAYCGYAPGQKRRKGVRSNWNAQAKMRAFLVAESAIRRRCKACGAASRATDEQGWAPPPASCSCLADGYELRTVYDAARMSWADRDVTDGHKHAHALRLVAKRVLLLLWRESKRLHAEGGE